MEKASLQNIQYQMGDLSELSLLSPDYQSMSWSPVKRKSDLAHSSAVTIVLGYLAPRFVSQLQILSRKFYHRIIPFSLYSMRLSKEPQFLVFDFKSSVCLQFLLPLSMPETPQNNQLMQQPNIKEEAHEEEEKKSVESRPLHTSGWSSFKFEIERYGPCPGYEHSELRSTLNGGFKVIATSSLGGRYFICGGEEQVAWTNLKNENQLLHIKELQETSPCFEFEYAKLKRRSRMRNQRNYFSLVCLTKNEEFEDFEENSVSLDNSISPFYQNYFQKNYLYAIGGKGQQVKMKSIEKYDIENDEWCEVKTQLNYVRAFSSAVCFSNRYIYVVGGTTDTECFEVFDSSLEFEQLKCSMIMLSLQKYIPWFKEILIPLNEDGIMFCGFESANDEGEGDSSCCEESQQEENSLTEMNSSICEQGGIERFAHEFLIVSNHFKTKKIKQLYHVDVQEKVVWSLDEMEAKTKETLMPFEVDTFFHQYYLKTKGELEANTIYMLGGNFIHKVNLKNKEWKTIDKGSDELLGYS